MAYTMEMLLSKGAKDVFFTPITMKKNRPATKLTVICDTESSEAMEDIIFTNLSTIGIRKYICQRTVLKREEISLSTSLGSCKYKICKYKQHVYVYPEYESVKALATKNNLGFNSLFSSLREEGQDIYSKM